MDEYALHMARTREQAGRWGYLGRVLANWSARRAFAALRHSSDYQLRDIGLTREDLERLVRLPLSDDPRWEAERLRTRAASTADRPK